MAGTFSSIEFQAQALQLQAERGRVLASNIANADTPNYKARDFDFKQALSAAAAAASSSTPPLARTQAGHLSAAPAAAPAPALLYRAPVQGAIDGNTVDLDAERANFAQNSVRYEASLRFLTAQFKQMMSAINGQ